MNNSRKLIYVVEDNPHIQDVIRIALSDAGYQVKQLYNSDQLNHALDAANPDLIILDLRLGGKMSLQISQELKATKLTCKIPIILTSADANIEKHFQESQSDAYLRKPFSISELLDAVGKVLTKQVA